MHHADDGSSLFYRGTHDDELINALLGCEVDTQRGCARSGSPGGFFTRRNVGTCTIIL